MKPPLEQLLLAAVGKLVGTLVEEMPDPSLVTVERTRDAAHGDFATSIAMRLAKAARKSPIELAQVIVAALPASPFVPKAEVASGGFINFFLDPAALVQEVRRIHELGASHGQSAVGAGKHVNIGVVAMTPTDVTQARRAVYTEALARVLAAAGYDVQREASLEAPVVRGVTLYRGQSAVNMTSFRELQDEVGEDACRFFFLTRSHEQHLDFDLKLATTRTTENPLYCVQYVHARVASVMKETRVRDLPFELAAGLDKLELLDRQTEQTLATALLRFPEELESAAANCAPHSIVYYLREVANAFHTYYTAEKWIVDEAELRNARLALVLAAGIVIRNGLTLLGVSAPESM